MSLSSESDTIELDFPQEKLDLNKFSKYFLGISSFLILIFSVTAVAIIKSDDFAYTVWTFMGNLFLIISYILGLVSIGIIAAENYRLKVKKKTVSMNFLIHFDTYKHQLKIQRASLMINTLLLVLGIGDAVFNLTKLADDCVALIYSEKETFSHMKYLVVTVSLFENAFKCIYHLSILVFILHHRKYEQMLKCLVIRIFLYSMSLTFLSQWFFVIFQEINHTNHDKNITKTNTTQHTFVENSYPTFNKIEQFLYPLGTEFRISMFIELFPLSLSESKEELFLVKKLNFYFHKVKQHDSAENSSRHDSKKTNFYVAYPEKRDNHLQTIKTAKHDKHKHSMVGHFCMFLSVLISIILVSASIVVIFFQDFKINLKISLVILVSEICETTFMTTSGIYLIFLLIKMYKSRVKKNNDTCLKTYSRTEEKTFDFGVLFVSQTSLVVYSLLTAVGSMKTLKNPNLFQNYNDTIIWLTFVTSVTSIFQSVLQTICIRYLKEKKILHKVYVRILILLNFGIWIFDTFSATKHETSQIQRNIYGKYIWEIICAIFIPLSIFYRIHSSIILIKLNSRAYNSMDLLG